MDKITIERETLELAIAALTYHQTQTRPIESTRITLETLRALLAAQPPTVDGHLKCGHHQSLAINSAETGEFLYCDLCDAKSRCRDAEAMEAELRAALAAQPAEPVAWLHICVKPGRREVYATVDPDDNKWWPADQWTSHTVHPLYAAPPAPAAVPPGMALMPIEPTPGIITTGTVALMKASDSDLDATREEIAATYRAMIAAAGDKP